MARRILTYISDSEEESELSVKIVGQGWVEYLQQFCQVYVAKHFPLDFYKELSNRLLENLQNTWPDIPDNFGYVHHLMSVLRNQDFVLPVFGVFTNGKLHLTCGNTRFAAHKFMNCDPASLGVVVLSDTDLNHLGLVKLVTTQQFTEIFELGDTDVKIVMDHTEGNAITVTDSVLRHTIYDRNPTENHAVRSAYKGMKEFWARYVGQTQKKVKTKIYCRPEHQQFILPSNVFEFEFVEVIPEEWQFSFGKLLGAFRKDPEKGFGAPTFNVWLFDASEPFHLEWFMPFFQYGASCVYTENRKIIAFDPDNHDSEYKIVSNIVK